MNIKNLAENVYQEMIETLYITEAEREINGEKFIHPEQVERVARLAYNLIIKNNKNE